MAIFVQDISVRQHDWMTQDVLAGYNLNERQMKAVIYLKIHQNITNTIYKSEFTSSKLTVSRDLDEMMEKGIIEKVGTTGKGVNYHLSNPHTSQVLDTLFLIGQNSIIT